MTIERIFARTADASAKVAGRPLAFLTAGVLVVGWALLGPVMRFSDTWQLMMNTVSSVITFLMVFLIQNSEARDSEAIQAKLDTLIAAMEAADQRYIGIERLPDVEIERLRQRIGPRPPKDSPAADE